MGHPSSPAAGIRSGAFHKLQARLCSHPPVTFDKTHRPLESVAVLSGFVVFYVKPELRKKQVSVDITSMKWGKAGCIWKARLEEDRNGFHFPRGHSI